jgi:hypothetical protein
MDIANFVNFPMTTPSAIRGFERPGLPRWRYSLSPSCFACLRETYGANWVARLQARRQRTAALSGQKWAWSLVLVLNQVMSLQ